MILVFSNFLTTYSVTLLTQYHTGQTFIDPNRDAFCKHCGKRRKAGNRHFLLFPQFFSALHKINFKFSVTFILLSADAFRLDQSKILSFGKEWKKFYHFRHVKFHCFICNLCFDFGQLQFYLLVKSAAYVWLKWWDLSLTEQKPWLEKKRESADTTMFFEALLLAHLSKECSVSYCDHSPSVVFRPSTIFLLTL